MSPWAHVVRGNGDKRRLLHTRRHGKSLMVWYSHKSLQVGVEIVQVAKWQNKVSTREYSDAGAKCSGAQWVHHVLCPCEGRPGLPLHEGVFMLMMTSAFSDVNGKIADIDGNFS